MFLSPRRLFQMFLIVAALSPGACADEKAAPTEPSVAPSPRVALEGVRLAEREGDRTSWDLKAAHVDYSTDRRVASLTGVEARFYEARRVVSIGRAPAAVFQLNDRQLRLTGGISIVTPSGERGFTASDATWLPGPGRLTARGQVVFWRGGSRLAGATLDADRALERVTLAGGVLGQVALAELGTSGLTAPSRP